MSSSPSPHSQPEPVHTPKLSHTSSNPSLNSPRASPRQPSISQSSLVDLLANPTRNDSHGPQRDWRTVTCKELIQDQPLKFVDLNTPVEEACQLLIEHDLSSLPIKGENGQVVGTFDYSDLNAFLLMVLGLWKGDHETAENTTFQDLTKKARSGGQIPVNLVKDLGKKDPFITVSETEGLLKLVKIFGSGVHRVAVVREGTDSVIGMISQLKIVTFFWEHVRSFPAIEPLFHKTLRDLNIGAGNVISINGDKRVSEALEMMNNEGISSLAVIDNHHNVVGNISTADVKHLTRSSSLPLVKSSCLQFLSVILKDRGLNDGKDSYPVFYVNQQSTLTHTVAKLVATKAHRMWLVEVPSSANSVTTTLPVLSTIGNAPPMAATNHAPVSTGYAPTANIGLGSMPTSHVSGRLIGVVSLTDILNIFGQSSGLTPVDPNEARRQRRRSSSSSVRASIDLGRGSVDLGRGSVDLGRTPSDARR